MFLFLDKFKLLQLSQFYLKELYPNVSDGLPANVINFRQGLLFIGALYFIDLSKFPS